MTRDEWKIRARAYELSARTLLSNARHDVAYHCAGISIECALKARVAGLFRANDIPERKFVDDIYRDGHDLVRLVSLAQLSDALAAEEQANPAFRANCATVRGWRVDSRYRAWSQLEASEMVRSALGRGSGVLPWLRRHW